MYKNNLGTGGDAARALAAVVLLVVTFVVPALAAAGDVATAPVPRETQVDFVGAGGLTLHGALLTPPGGGRGPAVLLLPGSGPTDRDGNQPPFFVTDTLKQMAEALSRHGVVTFRFDKRAAAVHAGDWPKGVAAQDEFFAWNRFVGDAEAAVAMLRRDPAVDPGRVAILGHSEGGLIALQIGHDMGLGNDSRGEGTRPASGPAKRGVRNDPNRDYAGVKPAALILVSTAGRDVGTVLLEQLAYQVKAGGVGEASARPLLDAARRAVEQVRKDSTVPKDLPAALKPLFPANTMKLWHAYCTIDPAGLAAAYPGPVLIVQGEKDVQVSPERDAKVLEAAFLGRPAPAGGCELVVVPGASHNLKVVKGVGDPGFAGPVEEGALKKVVSWTEANLGR